MLTLYWIPSKLAEPRRLFLAVVEKQLPVGVRNVHAKNFPVNIDVDLCTLRLLILPKTCSKIRNSVFAIHCTVYALDLIHTDGHVVAISEIHWVPHPSFFDRSSEFYKYLRKCKRNLVKLVCEVDIDASTWYRSRTFVAYHLLELREGKLSFHGVIPFSLFNFKRIPLCVRIFRMKT